MLMLAHWSNKTRCGAGRWKSLNNLLPQHNSQQRFCNNLTWRISLFHTQNKRTSKCCPSRRIWWNGNSVDKTRVHRMWYTCAVLTAQCVAAPLSGMIISFLFRAFISKYYNPYKFGVNIKQFPEVKLCECASLSHSPFAMMIYSSSSLYMGT